MRYLIWLQHTINSLPDIAHHAFPSHFDEIAARLHKTVPLSPRYYYPYTLSG